MKKINAWVTELPETENFWIVFMITLGVLSVIYGQTNPLEIGY